MVIDRKSLLIDAMDHILILGAQINELEARLDRLRFWANTSPTPQDYDAEIVEVDMKWRNVREEVMKILEAL